MIRDEELFRLAKKPGGTTCPLCEHHVQVYPRKFNCSMAYTLIEVYKTSRDWVNIGQMLLEDGKWPSDYGKLVWWNMLQKHPGEKEDGNSNGLYRITQEGIDFVEGYTTVISHAREYLSEVLYFEGKQIDIAQALEYGNRFKYDELIRGS